MQILNKAELQAGGFDTAADEWANKVGVVQTLVSVTTATHNIANDVSNFYLMNSASPQTVTIPADLTDFAIGSSLSIVRYGVGQVTIEAGAGVTIRKSTATLAIAAQYQTAQFIKVGANEWLALGSFN